jgi:hypothetical protein
MHSTQTHPAKLLDKGRKSNNKGEGTKYDQITIKTIIRMERQ